jgi:hypothetical protein
MSGGSVPRIAANFFLSLALYQAFFAIPASALLRFFGADPGYGEDHVGRVLIIILLLVPALAVALSTLCVRGLGGNRKALLLLSAISLPAYALMAFYGHPHGRSGPPAGMLLFAPLLILIFVALSARFLRIPARPRNS